MKADPLLSCGCYVLFPCAEQAGTEYDSPAKKSQSLPLCFRSPSCPHSCPNCLTMQLTALMAPTYPENSKVFLVWGIPSVKPCRAAGPVMLRCSRMGRTGLLHQEWAPAKMLTDPGHSEKLLTVSALLLLSYPQFSRSCKWSVWLWPCDLCSYKALIDAKNFPALIPTDRGSFSWVRTLPLGHLCFSGFFQVKILFSYIFLPLVGAESAELSESQLCGIPALLKQYPKGCEAELLAKSENWMFHSPHLTKFSLGSWWSLSLCDFMSTGQLREKTS